MMRILLALVLCICVAHAAEAKNKGSPIRYTTASWYEAGTRTASGARFNPGDPHMAAHKRLPFGSRLLLADPANPGKRLCVEINDRGPYHRGRELDLTRAAAEYFGFRKRGVMRLEVRDTSCNF